MRDENKKRKLRSQPRDHHEPIAAGAIGFAGRPFVFCGQGAGSMLRRSAGGRFRVAVGELAEVFGALFDE